jgi:hypothetical protein
MASPAQRTLNQSSLYTATRPPGEYHPQAPLRPDLVDCSIVAFSAPEIGTHRSATWPGLRVETVEGMRPTPFEYGFRAPWHLLITTEITECHDNKTFVEALPRSALRDFARTLTFVPAGHGLSRFLKPRTPTRTRTNSGIDGSPVVNISAGLNKLAKQVSHTVQWAHCLKGCVKQERAFSSNSALAGHSTKWPPALIPISRLVAWKTSERYKARVRGSGASSTELSRRKEVGLRPLSPHQESDPHPLLSSIHSFSVTCAEVLSAEDLAIADGAPLNAMLCEWPLCAKSCLSEWPHSATAPLAAVGNQAYG